MANMFNEDGTYNKTNWKAGDKITAGKLNKIEESLEAINNNDISGHVEADTRLDALEAKDVAHDKELTKIKNTIADNKAAAELGDYDINSRMTFLENELNEGIEEVHNVASTVDGKIATAEANMTAQVNQGKADMEAMVAEVEADLEGLHAKDEELSAQLERIVTPEKFGAKGDGVTDDTIAIQNAIDSIMGGGIVRLTKKYMITDTLFLGHGVILEGITNGIFSDPNVSTILGAIIGKPCISFKDSATGCNIKNIKLINFDSSFYQLLDGIELNKCEMVTIENCFIKGFKNGINCSGVDGPIYCVCFINNIINENDIGIYIKDNDSWSNAINIKVKEICDNRIGIYAEQGIGNTIRGDGSEIGRNTECGIKITGGSWTIIGQLWLENSPTGILIEGGNNQLIGDVYCISPIIVNNGVLVMDKQKFSNITNKQLSYKDIKHWFSFDTLDAKDIDYVTGDIASNDNIQTYEGIYGTTKKIPTFFYNMDIDTTKDFTILALFKSYTSDSETNEKYILTFRKDSKHINFCPSYINKRMVGIFTDNGYLCNIRTEDDFKTNYTWFILKYDSDNKTFTSLTTYGTEQVANASFEYDMSDYNGGELWLSGHGNLYSYDEVIVYNRKLDIHEIRNITSLQTIPNDLKINLLINKNNLSL